MAELSANAKKILKKCNELGYTKEGEAIQKRSYIQLFDRFEDADAAYEELVSSGLCEASTKGVVKLTADGARAAKIA